MSRIYLASSWRNAQQPDMCARLAAHGHEVYDFRNPPYKAGFSWKDIELSDHPSVEEYVTALEKHKDAAHGFLADFRAMQWADTCVMLLPCGKSAHIELGYMAGRGKRTCIYMQEQDTPELMYLCADRIITNMRDLINFLL